MHDDMDDPAGDAAIDRVRAELAQLGAGSPAPPAPEAVTARVVAALREAGDHNARRSRVRLAAAVGGLAAVVAIALGVVMILSADKRTATTYPTAERITTSLIRPRVPLSNPQIAALLTRPADLGALSDPKRLSSCLTGLGYPSSTEVLGAQAVDVDGLPGVVLVLPGTTPDQINAVLLRPTCSSIDTGLLADTQIARP